MWTSLIAWLCVGLTSAGLASATSFVVHLPSTPVENAGRRAEAVQKITERLQGALPGLELEVQIFRRLADAEAYLDSHDDVVLLLSDASWVPSLPASLEPGFSLVRNGAATYRQQLVAKEDKSLRDLQGSPLAIVALAPSELNFLRNRVFGGELDPADWFAELRPAVDNAGAITDVLYGEANAALVAEFSPLLAQHLGQGLRLVYTSGDLPLPVLSIATTLDDRQRRALAEAITGLGADVLGGLGFDTFTSLDTAGRQALRQAPASASKRLELPSPPAATLDAVAPPGLETLPLVIELPVPEPPSAAGELLAGAAGLERN